MAQPNGPYPSAELNFWVRKGTPGVFVLSRDGRDFEILGTATSSLRSTIREFLEQKKEDWFAFSYALSPARQFNVECEWYHAFKPSNYVEHPRPPQEQATLICPLPECPTRH